MKLLFVTFTYAPHQNGVAAVVQNQAEGLVARGHEVTVATSWDAQRAGRDSWNEVRVQEFRLNGSSTDSPDERRRFQEFVVSFPADVIICHCWEMWTTVALYPVLGRISAPKILVSHGYTSHRWVPYSQFAWGIGQWVRRWPFVARSVSLARKFDRLVVLSERCDLRNFIDHTVSRCFGWARCAVIPNGTNTDDNRFSRASGMLRRKFNLERDLVIVHIGVYAPSKGQKLAVRAFLRAGLDDAALVFIGNEFNAYSRQAKAIYDRSGTSRSRIIFLERQTREEILDAYADSDMVLLSSPSETQPLVLLDAMAAGKPFVATDVGCVKELPGGVVARGERGLAKGIRMLGHNPKLRAALARAGRDACTRVYNWNHVLDLYEDLFAQVTRSTR